MEDLSSDSTSEDRFRSADPKLFKSKDPLDDQARLGETPENLSYPPEMLTANVISDEMEEEEEDPSRSVDLAPEEMSDSFQGSNEEEEEMSDTDDPNLSGLSLLEPDPSLGCLPRRSARKRSTTWSYVVPEEPPEQRTWKYLMRHKIIELLEDMTAEIFFHRFESPIDYMIEATERAREKHREDDNYVGKSRRFTKQIDSEGNVVTASEGTLTDDDRSGASTEGGMMVFPSQEDYVNDVILVPTQDDVSAYDSQDKAGGDVTSIDREKKKAEKRKKKEEEEARDMLDKLSIMTSASDDGDVDDDVGGITCFPVDPSPLAELKSDREEDSGDVSSLDQIPRVITSTEAIQLLNYLS